MDILQLLLRAGPASAAIIYSLARNPATRGTRRGGPDGQPVCVSVIVVNAAPRQCADCEVRKHASREIVRTSGPRH
jgi:hypothetical protein